MPAIGRSQILVYAALAVVVAVLGARALRAEGGGAPPPAAVVEAPQPGPGEGPGGAPDRPPSPASAGPAGTRATDAGPGSAPSPAVVVHVAGAVTRPGVYRVRGDARLQDAVELAGGPRRGADLHALNLAARVTDGQQILVPRRGQRRSAAAPGAGTASTPAAPEGADPAGSRGGPASDASAMVDLNTASIQELETLDGVGPAIAQKIVAWREANGGFRSVDDLAQVSGIGPKKLEAIRPRVVV